MLNEANTVSGGKYLDPTNSPVRKDSTFGRVQGNGQNWLEFLVVQGDDKGNGNFSNTLDLRGWRIDWLFNKSDGTSSGHGELKFTNDPVWAALPRGTILTISEWQDVWYSKTADASDTGGGLPRVGGIDGLGNNPGAAYNSAVDYKLGAQLPGAPTDPGIFKTDTSWNPAANGGGDNGDWHMQVWAGDGFNPSTKSSRFFQFSGSVTSNGVTSQIGTEAGGLFVTNNDDWQVTIHDADPVANMGAGNVIEGPIGEHLPPANFGVNSTEIEHFENGLFAAPNHPTQADYLGIPVDQVTSYYHDGSSSTFGSPSVWNETTSPTTQDVSGLRNWVQIGDANLDGQVSAADYTVWRDHLGQAGDFRAGDFNGNGMVDADDYTLWKNNYGHSSPGAGAASSAVPEPAACLLLGLGGIALVCFYRSR
jgi:hypothetical protein